MARLNLTHEELDNILNGSGVNEEVMDTIIDVSRDIPLEFSDRLGASSTGNRKFEWTNDRLRQPQDSFAVDGQDVTANDAGFGARVANQVQIQAKRVDVSLLGEAANSIGGMGKIATQVSRRGAEMERDMERDMLANQAAVEGDGDSVASRTAGLEAFIDDQILVTADVAPPTDTAPTYASDSGSVQTVEVSAVALTGGGVSNISGGIIPAYTYTTVVPGAITETAINAVVLALYENTGSRANRLGLNRTKAHSRVSEYYFTSSARIATLESDTGQAAVPATAKGAVNAILTDYGIVDLVPNVFQPFGDVADSTPDSSTMFILDMSKIEMVTMTGFRVEPLAKTGLSEKRLLSKSWGLKVLSSEAQGMIQAIDESIAMVLV